MVVISGTVHSKYVHHVGDNATVREGEKLAPDDDEGWPQVATKTRCIKLFRRILSTPEQNVEHVPVPLGRQLQGNISNEELSPSFRCPFLQLSLSNNTNHRCCRVNRTLS